MEHQRFDAIARLCAVSHSRRQILRGLAGAAVATLGLRLGHPARAQENCPSGVSCTDAVTDAVACCQSAGAVCTELGACCESGVVCGDACCEAGTSCAAPPTGLCCSSGVACGGVCCDGAGAVCTANGACCESGIACGTNCCAPGPFSVCAPNGECCDTAFLCGPVCCDEPGQCLDPETGSCCGPSESPCGGGCCLGPCCEGICCGDSYCTIDGCCNTEFGGGTDEVCGDRCCRHGSHCDTSGDSPRCVPDTTEPPTFATSTSTPTNPAGPTQVPTATGGASENEETSEDATQLPATGTGEADGSDAWIAAAALMGGTAALLGARRVRRG
jgi:hypothetical protein